MGRTAYLCVSALLFSASILLLNLNACGSGNPSSSSALIPSGKLQHIVVIFQENRTPDNLFHDPILMQRGADIASSGLDSSGNTLQLTPTPLAVPYDMSHQHSAFVAMYDGGKMDGADQIRVRCPTNITCPPDPEYQYVQPPDVAPYFELAEQYTFGDRMFQTNEGPSFPAHQFIISGTSAPTATSNLFAAENPGGEAGCAASPGSYVSMIDPMGNESSTIMYPCFEHPTLTDELDAKGVSWRYYAPNAGSIWTGPNAIMHMCQPQTQNGQLTCSGATWDKVIIPSTQVLTDIANWQLPQVSWIIPAGQYSDHPSSAIDTGPSWVASIVNAIGNSSYWSNTAIIITWDDWGGWYDHVPPPKVINDGTSWGSGYVYGFRVPLIVVSPYAKAQYISHVTHDFGSILNLIEQTFGLASLNYADARADNLADCLNFDQSPLGFQTISAPLSAEHFLNDKTPPTDPDTD
jgi:phospholipase C